MIVEYILYSILTFFFFTLPGFLFVNLNFIKKRFDKLERIVILPVFSVLFFTFIGLVIHFIGLNFTTITLLLPTVFFCAVLLFFSKIEFSKEVKFFIALFFLQFILKIILQIFIPLFPMGGDWIGHYYESLDFLKPVWTLTIDLADRAPLYNLVSAIFLGIFGKDYWVMQIISSLLNSLFLIPTFLIAKKIFNKKVALLSFLFLSITPFAVETSLYTYPKNFAAFFILVFYYLIFTKRIANPLLGISAGLAYLAHPYSLLFTGSGILILLFKKQFQFNSFLKFIFLASLIVLPWLLWNFAEFGTIPSMFKYYPFAVNGYQNLHNESFQQVWSEFISKPLWYIVFIRIVNAAISLTPIFLLTRIASVFMPVTIQIYKTVSFSNLPWIYHHLQTIFGALTTLLFIFASIEFVRLFKNKKYRYFTWFVILPFLFSLVYMGWIEFTAHLIYQPLIPLLVMIGFFGVSKMKNSDKWVKLVFIFAIIESIIFIYWFSLAMEYYKQIAINLGTTGEYENLYTAYKLFFGGQIAINSSTSVQ